MRVVLDTNVCLDLFVFRDPRWSGLYAALKDGTVEAVTRADCRTEWLIVLEYSHLPLDPVSRSRAISEFDALITCLDIAATGSEERLPLCKDRDDQKFLELARDAHAAVLITKDKALLKLARKIKKAGLFTIMLPDSWAAHSLAGSLPVTS